MGALSYTWAGPTAPMFLRSNGQEWFSFLLFERHMWWVILGHG